ncbi:MAG TPA: efflux RND transporter periplasmic adaptor subunit [Myxococcota bacterium]|nr:efflux RND transporter periplasmic adaptor subunit [Myxococcota bacterium]
MVCAAAALWSGCERGSEKTAAPVPSVVVAPVEQRDVTVAEEWVGTTTGNVNAQIYPKIQGYLLKQNYANGAAVKAGEVLFQIDPRQAQAAYNHAKADLAEARARLLKTQQDVTRYTPLAKEGAVSQKELDDAVQAQAAAQASVEAAKAAQDNAQLNLDWTKVNSPIDGVAGIANSQVGDLVSPQTLLTEVSQLDPIKVSIQVSEVDYLRLVKRKEQQPAGQIALTLILADGSIYPEKGRFDAAGLGVAPTTGTIQAQVLFPNPGNLLRPGQFGKVRADTEQLKGALVIPQRAVSEMQGIKQVAVVGPDDKVAIKKVVLGPTVGTDVVVGEGLQAGERVIVEGLQKVRNGITVKAETTTSQAPAAKPGS